MRRFARIAGAVMIAAGVLTLAWAFTVWRWQDPFTALYTHWQQGRLADQYEHLLAGLSGPALLLWSFAGRYGLGWDAPWYVARLFVLGYAPAPGFVIALAWAAAAGQLAALAAGRYAPYPAAAERPPRGPLRRLIRTLVLAQRRRQRASEAEVRALHG